MNFSLYSHPNLLLKDHLQNVYQLGMERFKQNNIFPELVETLGVILLFHDFGKASSYFQDYLLKNSPHSKFTGHSEISALLAYSYLLNIYSSNSILPVLAFFAIRYHHGDLDDYNRMSCLNFENNEILKLTSKINFDELTLISQSVLEKEINLNIDCINKLIESFSKVSFSGRLRNIKKNIDDCTWFKLQYLFSLLIWADKNSLIISDNFNVKKVWKASYIDNYRSKLSDYSTEIGKLRNAAYEELSNNATYPQRIMSINLPTGTGKTIAALKVALLLKEQYSGIQRIIYCLPFTSIVDQNYKVYEDILSLNQIDNKSDILLCHHHLTEYRYSNTHNEYIHDQAEHLIETWNSELVVTTFYQLLHTFFSSQNRNLKRMHRIANAILILDEVQTVPHKYWMLIKSVFSILSVQMNIYIILVSATMPLIFNESKGEIKELAVSKKKWFEDLNRQYIDKNFLENSMSIVDFAKLLVEECEKEPDKNRLVILNTIKASQSLYKILQDEVTPDKLQYLSANIIPFHRLKRIEKIKKANDKGLIIISTQVVEAGVDIDLDIVYRDMAPLDSIIQACGRCNRNNNNSKGVVYLLKLKDDHRNYCQYIYDLTLIDATEKALNRFGDIITENNYFKLVNEYYRSLNEFNANDDSQNILEQLNYLNFASALNYRRDNLTAFNLIEPLPLKSLFIEIDNNASKVLNDYLNIDLQHYSSDYEKHAARKNIIRQMSPYIISVPSNLLQDDNPIAIVRSDELSIYYDIDTGFKREPEIKDYIF